jgi:hypothetical protein
MANELLIRASLTDDGTLPRTGDVSNSPDVISNGKTEVDNPVSYYIDTYDAYVSKNLQAASTNYIYVRGKSMAAGLQQGDVYVYFALDADLNTPSKWVKNVLQTTRGDKYIRVHVQSEGAIAVTDTPFVWTPPESAAGSAYSLIGIVVPIGTKPNFIGVTDFEEYVKDHSNIGWNKVTIDAPPPPPTPKLRWKTTFHYAQGDMGQEMNFQLKCSNIPTGSLLEFGSDNPNGPTPPIALAKTTVTDSNGAYGIVSIVPEGYTGNITFYFYTDDTPPQGSSITFTAYYYPSNSSGPVKPVVVAKVVTTN